MGSVADEDDATGGFRRAHDGGAVERLEAAEEGGGATGVMRGAGRQVRRAVDSAVPGTEGARWNGSAAGVNGTMNRENGGSGAEDDDRNSRSHCQSLRLVDFFPDCLSPRNRPKQPKLFETPKPQRMGEAPATPQE